MIFHRLTRAAIRQCRERFYTRRGNALKKQTDYNELFFIYKSGDRSLK